MRPQPAVDTVTDAVTFLTSEGYLDELEIDADGLRTSSVDGVHPLETARIDYLFRFEGPSDPGDEAIVVGVSCPEWDRRGILVSAFGSDADPDKIAILLALTRRPTD
ncbi:MAG: phosphoribosylpyrophosphate synthetase [Acidimicrobiales bacterium]